MRVGKNKKRDNHKVASFNQYSGDMNKFLFELVVSFRWGTHDANIIH
jgi:hypothetical protein